MNFLQCFTKPTATGDGDAFVLNCVGADEEQILFYPSINNVPLGGQEKYQARTTLRLGRSSCEVQEKSKSLPLVLPLACGGVALLILVVVAVLRFVRHRSEGYLLEKELREVQKRTKSQEMEVRQPENDPSGQLPELTVFHPQLERQQQQSVAERRYEGTIGKAI